MPDLGVSLAILAYRVIGPLASEGLGTGSWDCLDVARAVGCGEFESGVFGGLCGVEG